MDKTLTLSISFCSYSFSVYAVKNGKLLTHTPQNRLVPLPFWALCGVCVCLVCARLTSEVRSSK